MPDKATAPDLYKMDDWIVSVPSEFDADKYQSELFRVKVRNQYYSKN